MNNIAAALGFFDGVHSGHKMIAEKVVNSGFFPVVYTFDKHPKSVLGAENELIFTNERKKEAFLSLGIKEVIFEKTTPKFLKMPPKDFIEDILIKRLCCKYIAVGEDYTFGSGGMGNSLYLKSECEKHGVFVEIIPFIKHNGHKVSSSYIKTLIRSGDIDLASSLTALPYEISGTVISGRHDGAKFGFPTANVLPPNGLLLPPNGVYFTNTYIDGKIYPSVTNLGFAPTCGENQKMCETNLLNFDGDLYGKYIKTEFLHFCRSEKKFDGIDALKAQIKNDVAERENYNGTNR